MRRRVARQFKQKLDIKKQQGLGEKIEDIIQFGHLGCEFMNMPTMKINQINKTIKQEIESQKLTAQHNNLCGVSSPMIGHSSSLFVLNKKIFDEKNYQIWNDKEYQIQDYKAYINPKIIELPENINGVENKQIQWEFNPCFPVIKIQGHRYQNIGIQYYDENMELQQETLSEFPALVFQQHLDLVHGKDILDWRINHGIIEPVEQQYADQFPKFFKVISEFSYKVQQLKEDFPDMFKLQDIKDINKPLQSSSKTSWEDDVNKRLLKNIRKDLRKLVQQSEEIKDEKEKEQLLNLLKQK